MATATCLNDECDKEEWTLTKPPSEYARGVTCPTCGTTRVDHSGGGEPEPDGENRQTNQQSQQSQQPQQQSAPPRGDVQPQPAQQTQQAPATQEPQMGAGEGLIAAMDAEAPPEVKKKGVETIGRSIIRIGKAAVNYGQRKEEMRNQRARNSNVQRVEDKPSCEECDFVFDEISLNDDRVKCPNCGIEYEIVPEDA